jgi:uncharacterized protein Usg
MIEKTTDRSFKKQLKGFSLTTAEILYHMPDYPSLLQTYIWQEYDLHPHFPKLYDFLNFWSENLDGRLFKIRVANRKLISPAEMRVVNGEFVIN